MKLKPRPRAEVEAYWREREADNRRPLLPSRNRENIFYLKDPMRMAYRGRIYELLPVPFRKGVQAIHIQEQMFSAAGQGDHALYGSLLEDAVKLIRSGVRPHRPSWVMKIAWALGWDPFKQATEQEVGEFLVGFMVRRTMPRA
jgi:hypothetical protein